MLLKRLISAVTGLSMAFALTSAIPLSAEETPYRESTVLNSNEDVRISGTNSFGRMLAYALDEKSNEQNDGNGCNIFSVEVEGNVAIVDYQSTEDCTLMVGIYSDDGVEMITSGTAEVSAEKEFAEVTLNTEEMPEYFYIRAFLVDSTMFRPLSVVYESPMYTQEMQEFLAKTTADFDEERVLNLDDDSTTNFAVYGENTILLDESDGQLTQSGESYVINGASERLKSLKEGDTFAYGDAENVVIVTVKTIEVNGDTVTVTNDDDAELEDVFEYVKIEAGSGMEDAAVDTSMLPEEIKYLGAEMQENTQSLNSPVGYQTVNKPLNAFENGGEISGKLEYELKADSSEKGGSFTGRDSDGNILPDKIICNGNCAVEGKVSLSAKLSLKVYLSRSLRYLEFKDDYELGFETKVTINGYIALPLGVLKFKPLPFINIEFIPSIVFEGKIEIVLKFDVEGCAGIRISNQGNENLSKKPKRDKEIKAEGKLFFGLSFAPEINIIHDKVAKAKLDLTVGLVLESKRKNNYTDPEMYKGLNAEEVFNKALVDDSVKSVHLCQDCYELSLSLKLTIKGEVSFIGEWLKIEGKYEAEWPIWKGHWSMTYGDFGSSGCPYEKFKVKVHVQNIEDIFANKGTDLKNADVRIAGDTYSTGESGYFQLMLSSGKYETESSCGDLRGGRDITIEDEPADIIIPVADPANALSITSTLMTHGINLSHANSGNVVDAPDNIDGKKVVQVAMGAAPNACITEDGSLYTWGDNGYGQLGDGTTVDKHTPIKIMENVAQVNMSFDYSACITKDGSLYTWGNNYRGQLGDGTTKAKHTPVKIMDNVAQVNMGSDYSACITKDGSLYTWGYNGYGMIGDGSKTDRYSPVKIMDNVTQVCLGYYSYSAACITKDGSLYTWGNNRYGQLGDGTTENKHTPVKIMDNVSQVSLGAYSSACITKDGSLFTWGYNSEGQLGDGTTKAKHTPVKIMDNVAQVNMNFYYSACINKDGSLYTWGRNDVGQLGDGTTEDKYTPVKIMDNVAQVNMSSDYSACITKDGSLYTWGSNGRGRLGDGTTEDKLSPGKIMDNVAQVSLVGLVTFHLLHSVCITKDGSLYTWGDNFFGNLGDGTTEDKLVPTKIVIPNDDTTYRSTDKTQNALPENEREPVFTDLIPHEIYNLYAFKDVDAGLTADDLLYVTQQTADENGSIDFDYILKNRAESGTWLAVPMNMIDISYAEVSVTDLDYTGEEQFVSPVVTVNGVTLTEGVDFYLEGDYSATEAGEYNVMIAGMGLYTGSVSVSYKVNGKTVVIILGDVNNDGKINVTDVSKTAAHVKGIRPLDENAQKRADVNGDNKINVTDIAKIAAHVKGIKPLN